MQQLVTWVQYANDEGDPGMGLELGLDLFCHGGAAGSTDLLIYWLLTYSTVSVVVLYLGSSS